MARQPLRVGTICTGNICRSPMVEVILQDLIALDPVLKGHVLVTSAGTARWHVGSPMDERARRALNRAGYYQLGSPGAFADTTYLDRQDLVLVMTREHRHDVYQRLSNTTTDVVMWRNLLEPGLDLDFADPYYDGDEAFDDCVRVFTAGGRHLTSELRLRWGARVHEA